MNSRERVIAAIEHRRPDRPPLNYFGTSETTEMLLAHLCLETKEDLLRYFGADMRYVAPRYVGPDRYSGMSGFGGGGTDIWGVEWQPCRNAYCTYYEVSRNPMAGISTVAEVEAYPWPDPDWFDPSGLAEEIRRLNADEPRAIVLPVGSFFETAWWMRGLETFLMDLVERPAVAERILRKATDFFKEVSMRAVDAADGQIDIAWSSSDIGMQTGMIFSPDLWRTCVKPFHRELVTPFREMGLKTRYHSDGAFADVIEDMIEMGLDLLDPIQPKATGMDADNLARRFGGRLAFYGGVDTQELLPMGTARQVEEEVLRLIRVLGSNGGYVVAASNAVQPDVPVENILALYLTARDYRY